MNIQANCTMRIIMILLLTAIIMILLLTARFYSIIIVIHETKMSLHVDECSIAISHVGQKSLLIGSKQIS